MQGVPRFAEATVRVVEEKHAGWRTPATGRDWVSSFERYAFPRIGKMPVWEDTSAGPAATFVFFEDARRGFDAFLGQLWHGADQMRPDVRVIMTLNIMTLILVS